MRGLQQQAKMKFDGLTYYGGKKKLAPFIVSLFPHDYKKLHYIEPFFGGGAVLFKKNKSKYESINDLDKSVYKMWKVLREQPKEFEEKITTFFHSELDFIDSRNHRKNNFKGLSDIDICCYKLVNILNSFGGIGVSFSSAKTCNIGALVTIEMIKKQLDNIKDRMRKVQIFNKDAIDLIRSLDSTDALFYLDPPYPEANQKGYDFKYSLEDFNNLCNVLSDLKGKFILSFYDVEGMKLSKDWKVIKKEVNLHCKGNVGKKLETRTEVMALNYDPKETASQRSLF